LFDPRREHSSAPIANSSRRRDAGTIKAGRNFAATRPGLGLDGPEHGGMLAWRGRPVATWAISNLVLGHFLAAANIRSDGFILIPR
jgi:hypothetical protein